MQKTDIVIFFDFSELDDESAVHILVCSIELG